MRTHQKWEQLRMCAVTLFQQHHTLNFPVQLGAAKVARFAMHTG